MNDWNYCVETLPKVSRTFALNISVLKGDLHKSILVAYLFCRTIDTVEDASKLDVANKVRLLLDFASLLKNTENRKIKKKKAGNCKPDNFTGRKSRVSDLPN